MDGIWQGLLVLIGFSFLIGIHELGHFLAAKRAGIQCPAFSIGFPLPNFITKPLRIPDRWKNIFAYTWRGTEYRIGWIPLGGFVQMKGQSDSPEGPEENEGTRDDFRNVSFLNKVIVICGGVFMNAVTGIVFFILAFMIFGVTFVEPKVGSVQYQDPESGEITPMWENDTVRAGDRVVAVNEEEVEDYLDIVYEGAFSDGDSIPVTLEREVDGETKRIKTDISLVQHSLLDFKVPGITQPLRLLIAKEEAAKSDGKLKAGDFLLKVNGQRVTMPSDVTSVLERVRPGEEISVVAQRGSGEKAKTIEASYVPSRKPSGAQGSLFGMVLKRPVLIKAVQKTAPAYSAVNANNAEEAMRLRKDDEILAWRLARDGEDADAWQEAGSPAIVSYAVQRAIGGALDLRVRRLVDEEFQTLEIRVTPVQEGPSPRIGVIFHTTGDAYAKRTELFATAGVKNPTPKAMADGTQLHVAWVMPKSAAAKAGVKAGDVIVDVPDQPKSQEIKDGWFSSKEVPVALESRLNNAVNAASAAAVAGSEDAKLSLKLEGRDKAVEIAPDLKGPASTASMAIGARESRTPPVTKGFLGSIESGFHHSYVKTMQIFDMLGGLFSGDVSLSNLSGPVMIVQMSYTLSEYGFGTLLFFLGFISINLAIINLLPLPVLDGGLLVIVTIEKITGRPINETFLNYLQLAGTIALVLLLIYVVSNDIEMLSYI